MRKQRGKSKNRSGESNYKHSKSSENSPRSYDKDTVIFISMSQELKHEGNRLFQKRDYEGSMLMYDKAIKLLPRNHIDVSNLRSNMAACYMQLGISEYPRAIHECNLALEVTPKYSKALLKRGRCYEALNRLDLALRDVGTVLSMEPNNLMAIEIAERVKKILESRADEFPELVPVPEFIPQTTVAIEKSKKKKISINDRKIKGEIEGVKDDDMASRNQIEEKKAKDKLVMEEEKGSNGAEEEPKRTVKLVFGEDIRWAQIPVNCNVLKLRDIISDRFPSSSAVLVKYRDQEGDLVTITTAEELRWAEASAEHGSIKLYIVEVNPEQDPFFHNKNNQKDNGSTYISDWIIQFAQYFNNYVGFDTDAYLDVHEVATKVYSEAIEETVTSEEAQDLFNSAGEKFQEMAALALFNWGNVHMSRARKRVYITEDSSREFVLAQLKSTYDWAQMEYLNAGMRYKEALKIKPNLYEAVLALGQQQFEKAKLSWYYTLSNNVDLKPSPSEEVFQLYNSAEENMEHGMQIWEEAEKCRLNELSKPNRIKNMLQKMELDNMFTSVPAEEASEQATNIQSQMYVLWGTILYERSLMEFKLGLPVWKECLEIAVEKFELAGASHTDIAVMIKNHCSNDKELKGLGFNINEIVQAWNEMYDAKRLQSSVTSFRLEPLLRRRVSKIYYALQHA